MYKIGDLVFNKRVNKVLKISNKSLHFRESNDEEYYSYIFDGIEGFFWEYDLIPVQLHRKIQIDNILKKL